MVVFSVNVRENSYKRNSAGIFNKIYEKVAENVSVQKEVAKTIDVTVDIFKVENFLEKSYLNKTN